MVRRAMAVMAACLFTLGTAALQGPGAATRPTAVRKIPPDCAQADARSVVHRHPGSVHHPHRGAARDGRPVADAGPVVGRGVEPYAPGPDEVARILADPPSRPGAAGGHTLRYGARTVTVGTWVHVIADGVRRVTRQAITDQIDTLNAAYGGRYGGADTKVRFRLDGITVTEEPLWFRDPLGHEALMKRKLRKGGATTLNLYLAQLNELVLGYATYPFWYRDNPILDGVIIDWRTLPGGTLRYFDRGFTGVHEIGHWLGLVHTFENGCALPGDGVADTPPQAEPTEGCPVRKDTCLGGGSDPIHNFMDYAHDRCMSEFTPGQAARMRTSWTAYREGISGTTLDR
ncbi:zinc metalloprotease [Streptosporangium sp. KLBMP 9127]|nr:zinc metalloprotease [Streptosporangium sp. KLBMP 9127]